MARQGKPLRPVTRLRIPPGAVCSFPECGNPVKSRGQCGGHAAQRRRGQTLRSLRSGGPYINADGYRILYRPGHVQADKRGYVAEHRAVMAEHLGRRLRPDETVHHRNGVRLDNRLANLELWSSWQPAGQRVEDKVAWAREILDIYT